MSIKTTVCTKSPVAVGHPVGDAIIGPKIRRTNLNVSGLAMIKKIIPETIEIINFSSCFLPLHPHPQSLNRPIVCLICTDKKILVYYKMNFMNNNVGRGRMSPLVLGGGLLVIIIIVVSILWATGVFDLDEPAPAVATDELMGEEELLMREEELLTGEALMGEDELLTGGEKVLTGGDEGEVMEALEKAMARGQDTSSREGEPCEGSDPFARYKIDRNDECVIDSCIDGYIMEDNLCVFDGVKATGGTETVDGDFKIHTFTTNGEFNVTRGGKVDILVVAGGGGGGNRDGGGGGGGGLIFKRDQDITTELYRITVGSGGNGGTGGVGRPGERGMNSVFGTHVAEGGGSGGAPPSQVDGGDGGSGGGGSGGRNGGAGGKGIAEKGNDGGMGNKAAGFDGWAGGGGGGAGSKGGDATAAEKGGKGGDGKQIFGTFYAGGGGSGGRVSSGDGGKGGGGNGGNPSGQSGVAGTGGGGGGGRFASGRGGNGGSGIVIIRYRT